ncbi:MAG: hypothetical protein IJW26_02415 [Clostridia bacterium]|nr:hypothetical protein [Clostridia bacterium]
MSIYPCVRWQGKSISEQNSVYESSYTDFSVPKKTIKQDEIPVESNQENQVEQIEEQPAENQVEQIEEQPKQDETKSKQIKKQSLKQPIKTQTKVEDSLSNFKFLESLINDLYSKVFSLSPNFRPTKNQTIGDLLIYLGYRAKAVGVYEKFKNVFKITLNEDDVRSKDNYVPIAVKLTVYLDKKKDEGYTKQVVSYLLKSLLYLFEDNSDEVISLTVNSMSAIYSYLIDNNINVN